MSKGIVKALKRKMNMNANHFSDDIGTYYGLSMLKLMPLLNKAYPFFKAADKRESQIISGTQKRYVYQFFTHKKVKRQAQQS